MRARADEAELLLTGKQNQLQTATLTGQVHVERIGSQPMQGDAGRVLLDFRGQNELQKVHASKAFIWHSIRPRRAPRWQTHPRRRISISRRQRSTSSCRTDVAWTAPKLPARRRLPSRRASQNAAANGATHGDHRRTLRCEIRSDARRLTAA